MNLSLISQKPSSPTTLGVLAALRAASEESDYVTEVRVAQPQQWQPSKEEAAVLLLEDDDGAWPAPVWSTSGDTLGLPVLPLLVQRQYDRPRQGPDVRDPHFYFVSNGIVLDEGLLFRTNESAFVETKRKLLDECDLWAIVSLPGGVFSTAGAGVKTNLLFFTKGRRTERIWYYDLSWVKVGKKTPLTLAHFGFDQDGGVLADEALPAALRDEWDADEASAGQPFPSYARMLASRGESRHSWTVDFAARRAKAREDMQPLLDQAAGLRAEVVGRKEEMKRRRKDGAADTEITALHRSIQEQEKAARDLEAEAAAIDAAVFDLKAVNPNAVAFVDAREPGQIIAGIEEQGQIIAQALGRLKVLLAGAKIAQGE